MASGSKTRTSETYLKCTTEDCGNVVQIHRKRSKMREKNHVKHMYCYKCKETTAHVEEKEDLFLPEWLREQQEEENDIGGEQI